MRKVALVHDWLIHMRGGEKVLESLTELFPEAPIYTLFCDRAKLSPVFKDRVIHTSFLQWIPGIRRFYRWLLPFFPLAIRLLRLENVELVISSSHCVAKGVRIPKGAYHICYCHTPMRYIWGFEKQYFDGYPVFIRAVIYWILPFLKSWDLKSNEQVDLFIANSENIKQRIQACYQKSSSVIYPPLDESQFYVSPQKKEDYYVVVSALVPYKRVDLVVEAFNGFGRKLIIIGKGPEEKKCRQLAQSDNIVFRGALSSDELRPIYAQARALIFPTDEDFGIVPLEAQACGTPVVAFKKGGALESVKSGVFFEAQTPQAIRQAVIKFETLQFDVDRVSNQMSPFSKSHFKTQIHKFVQALETHKAQHVCC